MVLSILLGGFITFLAIIGAGFAGYVFWPMAFLVAALMWPEKIPVKVSQGLIGGALFLSPILYFLFGA